MEPATAETWKMYSIGMCMNEPIEGRFPDLETRDGIGFCLITVILGSTLKISFGLQELAVIFEKHCPPIFEKASQALDPALHLEASQHVVNHCFGLFA